MNSLYIFFYSNNQKSNQESHLLFRWISWICKSCSLLHDELNWTFLVSVQRFVKRNIWKEISGIWRIQFFLSFDNLLATKLFKLKFILIWFSCKSINCEFINVHCPSIPKTSVKFAWNRRLIWSIVNWITKSRCYISFIKGAVLPAVISILCCNFLNNESLNLDLKFSKWSPCVHWI